ncbi:Os07g0456800 [Oryza sativa Japonica Group]|uniref:Os07g0456800 protein n=1 Tax=Oryza sativa subsp. japonica TaxID=39947 RepID=A0A0P0X5K8_ORYSJ|nr:hypothetical protein EE612_038992 [Oryza sativa]BAT01345.1 Os07g0456800 [Oryza sativa Japonica Group]
MRKGFAKVHLQIIGSDVFILSRDIQFGDPDRETQYGELVQGIADDVTHWMRDMTLQANPTNWSTPFLEINNLFN